MLFDAMGAMSSAYNSTPERASRAYDKNRDGFVISAGAGVLVLEDYERAKARGARIYGEIAGYGATSDGADMVAPSGEGAARCMRQALADVKAPIDYINPHATSTPVGDLKEIEALREVFGSGDKCPPISATKSLTGHSQGATGVHEAIYSLLMMQNGFICESAHIDEIDPAFADMPIVRKRRDNVRLGAVLSNSFGFGGDQRHDRVQARRRLTTQRRSERDEIWPDERQARPRDGRRQRSFDRLGHRPGAGRRRAPNSPSPIKARRWANACGRSPRASARSLSLPCDVEDVASLDAAFASARARAGATLDFVVHCIGFSDRNELKGRYADTTRENFVRTMVDFGVLLHRSRQARRGADAERRRDADADLRRRDARHAQLQRDGRRQGGAGGERALSGRRFRPRRHPRQRHFRRPDPHARRAPASPTRASCSISSATIRRCAAP